MEVALSQNPTVKWFEALKDCLIHWKAVLRLAKFKGLKKLTLLFGNWEEKKQFHAIASFLSTDAKEKSQLKFLSEKGYLILEKFFSEKEIDALANQFDALLADPKNLEGFNNDSYHHSLRLRLKEPLLRWPEMSPFVLHPSLMKLAYNHQRFLSPYSVQAYRALVASERIHSGHWHRDAPFAFTIFVYLGDVDENSGATLYVEGSHGYKWKDVLTPALTDESIQRTYGADKIKYLSAPKGSVVFLDATGIHRGPNWNNPSSSIAKPRNALQVNVSGRMLHHAPPSRGRKLSKQIYQTLSDPQKTVMRFYQVT